MAWYTGKTALAVAGIGDSNMLGSGGFTPPGGQVTTSGLWCYASASGQVPYAEANLGWRNALDPNGTNRVTEYFSAVGMGDLTYIGQLLGGNGNAAMQIGATLKTGTGIDTYLYQAAAGGTTANFWANTGGWDTLLRTIPAALAAIPGAPTYFDVVYISLGTNDCNQNYTAEQFYTNMKALRTKMIAEGWWVPQTTRVVLMDLPRNGLVSGTAGEYPDTWLGIQYVLARFNDRISMINSIGMEYEATFPVHYLPTSYTSMGLRAGELLLADIPKQQSTFTIGGTRLSFGGTKLRVNSA